MVGLSSFSQTTSTWNPSPRRTWQTHQPACSACYCASGAMTTPFVTTPVSKWPCLTHSLSSVYILDLTSHWTSPSTMLACPQRGRKHSNKPLWATLTCMLLPTWSSLVGLMTSRWSLTCYSHTGNIVRPSPLKMALSYMEKPSSSLHQKGERILQQLHQFHQGTTKAQLFAHGCVFWMGWNKTIAEAVWQCKTCTQFQAQNAASPLTPMPTLSYQWQMCVMDIFTLEGIGYLICGDFYSKMIIIQCLPSGQGNTVKVVSLLKEMFSENGIPKILHSDNDPQYASAQFTEFCMQVHSSLSSVPLWVSHMRHQAPTTHNWMDLQTCAWNLWSMHSNVLSTVVPTPSSPFWCSELHPSMPRPHHLLSSCTNARLGPPFLPEFATLTWQPSRFMNKLMPAPMPLSSRQTNDANPLHPYMPASPLQCTTPSIRSGSLPLWYVSCQKTATK